MLVRLSTKGKLSIFYCCLIAFCLAPVWSVEHFVNQDGSAHIYSSFAIIGMIRDSPEFSSFFAFNSIAVPNSSGHWLMAGLALFFSPWIVTKLIVSATFAGFVAGAGWLRYRLHGLNGVATSFLIGAAIGFNWLWLVGFYNFLIGAICFLFTVGLVAGWKDTIDTSRGIALGGLFLLAYFSHVVSFGVLAGSVILMTMITASENRRRNLLTVLLTLLPVAPLALIFRSISASGSSGGFAPVWRNLATVWSPESWVAQLRSADPFILISRKAFPFLPEAYSYFAIFAPILWIGAAVIALLSATILARKAPETRNRRSLVFGILFFGTVAAALFSPDDFGLTNGSVLRERLFICGLMFIVPLFPTKLAPRLKMAAVICLSVVVVFQTAVLWEYSLTTDGEAREFAKLEQWIEKGDRVATITIDVAPKRFSSAPVPMMSNYFGAGGKGIILDNYELGHYLFPVAAKTPDEKAFILELTQNSVLRPAESEVFTARKNKIEAIMKLHRINKLILVGRHPEVSSLVEQYFVPIAVGEKYGIYRARN